MIVRKTGAGANLLSTTLSALAIGAVLVDEEVIASEGFELTLMLVAPFVIFVWSLYRAFFAED